MASPEIPMKDPLELLESVAAESVDVLWYDFAKEGNETAALAPLARYPNASAWLARKLATSSDGVTRKLGAMLAGWVQSPRHVGLLSEMLDHERKTFHEDTPDANSVGEDIMFAGNCLAG
jgi:hypothetical protein